MKGIDLIGTGDVQFPKWNQYLQQNLEEIDNGNGIFVLKSEKDESYPSIHFVLQTEIIFTAPIKAGGKKRKQSHTLLLFPSFETVSRFYKLAESWGSKLENIARPFILCSGPEDVNEKINAIKNIDPLLEVIPAHIMTPDGVFGSNHKLSWLHEFYGDSAQTEIHAIETGLSADPELLYLIPELDNKVLLSNSDAHSASLNRIGREYTNISIQKLDYKDLITALRSGDSSKINYTAEFKPTEGRYFLTGHRASRHNNNGFCKFSPKYVPKDKLCPICKKPLTEGALSRAMEISRIQGADRQFSEIPNDKRKKFFHLIPLLNVIAEGLGLKNPNSKRTVKVYMEIVKQPEVKNETNLWTMDKSKLKEVLTTVVSSDVLNAILAIKENNFSYDPGFDGEYGKLVIGRNIDYLEINQIVKI